MGGRRRPAEEAEQYQYEADEQAAPPPRPRRPPDHNPAWLYFTHRETGTDGGRRQYTPDPALWVRCIRGNNERPGVYDVEVRNKNQSIIDRAEIEVTAEAAPASPQTTQGVPTPPAGIPNSDAAQLVGSVADAFVSINKVVKDNAPPPPPPVDVERLISGVAEAVKAAQPAQPPDPLDNLVNTFTKLKALGLIPEKAQEPPPAKDPTDTFLDQYNKFRSISDELGPQPENKGWGAQIGSFFEGLGRGVEKIAPSVPHVIGALRMGAQLLGQPAPGTQPQPGDQSAAQGQPAQAQAEQSQLPPALVSAARALAKEVTRDDVEKGADIVESLAKSDPMLGGELQGLFSLPSVSLVEWLASVSGAAHLVDLPHGVSYFDSLKEELNERAQGDGEEEPDAAEADASANGHRAQATGAAQG